MKIDPEYLAPDQLKDLLHGTFQESTSGALKSFLAAHRSVRKWIIVSDFVLADPKAFRDAYVYTLFPYETDLEQLQSHLAKLAPRDLKKSKEVSSAFTDYIRSGAVFSVCFLTQKGYRVAGNIDNVRASLDKSLAMMRSWHDADTQVEVIEAFRMLRQRANANNFSAKLMSTMVIATSVAAFVALMVAAEGQADLVSWFPDRDNLTHAYDRIASYMFAVNFSAFCQQRGIDQRLTRIGIGDANASDIGGEDAWYDELIRIPDALAGAIAMWDYEKNLVPPAPKYDQLLRQAVAENPYLVILPLMVRPDGRGVGVIKTYRSPPFAMPS